MAGAYYKSTQNNKKLSPTKGRKMGQLKDTKVKSLQAKDKDYKLADGDGLFLYVTTKGRKLWKLRYFIDNKEKKYSLGEYVLNSDNQQIGMSISVARNEALKIKQDVKKGIDPNELKKEVKIKKKIEIKENEIKQTTFKNVAELWLKSYESEVTENYHTKISRALELYTYPFIGNTPITEIKRLDLISILTDLKERGLKETANRTFQLMGKVFMYAVTMELVPHNITADIDKKTVLGKKEVVNYPSLTKEDDIKGLLLAIDNYKGDVVTQKAMKILPYVFVRSFNLRHMEWSEIDLIKKEWIIPKEKMKMKAEFVLPLPHQVITILQEMKQLSENQKYVFPSFRLNKPLSDNTFITALRRMGYTNDEMVPHSFRTIFSTLANENSHLHKHSHDVIEALLAHKEKNQVRGAYNRAEYTNQMRELIQWYADYLDSLKIK